jgi:hypothetical protein
MKQHMEKQQMVRLETSFQGLSLEQAKGGIMKELQRRGLFLKTHDCRRPSTQKTGPNERMLLTQLLAGKQERDWIEIMYSDSEAITKEYCTISTKKDVTENPVYEVYKEATSVRSFQFMVNPGNFISFYKHKTKRFLSSKEAIVFEQEVEFAENHWSRFKQELERVVRAMNDELSSNYSNILLENMVYGEQDSQKLLKRLGVRYHKLYNMVAEVTTLDPRSNIELTSLSPELKNLLDLYQ